MGKGGVEFWYTPPCIAMFYKLHFFYLPSPPPPHAFMVCSWRTASLPKEHQRDFQLCLSECSRMEEHLVNPKKMALAKLHQCTGKANKIDDSTNSKKGNCLIWYLTVL
jgi:hypothetical protein